MICNTKIHTELLNLETYECPFCGLLLVKGDTLVPQRLNYITEDPLRDFLRIQEVLKFSENGKSMISLSGNFPLTNMK